MDFTEAHNTLFLVQLHFRWQVTAGNFKFHKPYSTAPVPLVYDTLSSRPDPVVDEYCGPY